MLKVKVLRSVGRRLEVRPFNVMATDGKLLLLLLLRLQPLLLTIMKAKKHRTG
jgi:hypothetical protein